MLPWVGRALRARRWADRDSKLAWRTDGSESRPYLRSGAARGHAGMVTCGHGEMALEMNYYLPGR